MSRKSGFTRQKMEDWIKEGRGRGSGMEYSSWLKTRDVPSLGRVNRIMGNTIPRMYELMSDMEQRYFVIVDAARNVLDIREQFPLLPIEETEKIAAQCNITHPKDPLSKEDIVLTTDFVIDISYKGNRVQIARTVKPSKELVDSRVIEKFEIERRYWEARGIDWGIVTELDISTILAENLDFIRNSQSRRCLAEEMGLQEETLTNIVPHFLSEFEVKGRANARDFCYAFDKKNGFEEGSSIAILKHLLAKKIVVANMDNQKINFDSEFIFQINLKGEENGT